MADDHELYELAKRFPAAVLALLGLPTDVPYRGEALEVKATSGRFDAVLTPEQPPALVLSPVDRAAAPRAPRIFVEFQNRHDGEAELRWALKLVALVSHTPPEERGPVRFVAVYGQQRFLDAARGGADLGDDDEQVLAFTPRRLLLSDVDPARLEAAGWVGRIVLPLVGTEVDVQRNAGRWARDLQDDGARTTEERDKAIDLFLRFLSGRLGDVNMDAVLRSEGIVVEDTATGRALIAHGEARGEARGRVLGEVIGLRRAILDVLEARGIAVRAEVTTRLDGESDIPRLEEILRAAVRVDVTLEGLFPS